MSNHFGSTLRKYILYTLYVLYSSSKCEHQSKCYEECCSYKKKCLRTCLSFRDIFRRYWLRSDRSHWSSRSDCWSIELIGDTLVVSSSRTLESCSKIDRMSYCRESENTDHFTIFFICLIECISCSEVCFEKSYLCSRGKRKVGSWSCTCSWPLDVTRVFPYTCFTGWSSRPYRVSKFYHIWSLLLIFIRNENIRSSVGPAVEKSSHTTSDFYTSSVETLITAIDTKGWIRTTTHYLVLTENTSSRRTQRCRCSSRRSRERSRECRRDTCVSSSRRTRRSSTSDSISRRERSDRSHHHDGHHTEREWSHK